MKPGLLTAVAIGLVVAGGAAAEAQQPGSGVPTGQPGPVAADLETALDDAELLSRVLAALPPGVSIETATDDQLSLAVTTVIAAIAGAPAAAGLPGQVPELPPGAQPNLATIASRVLSVVTISLDAIGRSDLSNAVAGQVVAALPPQVQQQVQQQVQASRAEPTPSQAAAAAVVIAQVQPALGQQQPGQQPVTLAPPPPTVVENPSQTGSPPVVGGDDDDDPVSPS